MGKSSTTFERVVVFIWGLERTHACLLGASLHKPCSNAQANFQSVVCFRVVFTSRVYLPWFCWCTRLYGFLRFWWCAWFLRCWTHHVTVVRQRSTDGHPWWQSPCGTSGADGGSNYYAFSILHAFYYAFSILHVCMWRDVITFRVF